MNLREAYDGWAQQSQNRELYARTRVAFRKAWFMLETNQPCSHYTERVLGEALAATREIESNKAKAASVMIHVLTFANFAEPDENPKPEFTFSDLMEYTKGTRAGSSMTKEEPITAEPVQEKETATDEPADGDAPAVSEDKANNEDMGKVKKGICAPKKVVRLDGETLKPMEEYDSIVSAQKALGLSNITRAVRDRSVCGGSYWCRPGEEEGFAPAERKRRKPAKNTDAVKVDAETETVTVEEGKERKSGKETPTERIHTKAGVEVTASGGDAVNHPGHYNRGGIECLDVIRAVVDDDGLLSFCIGNAIKYIFRHRHKGRAKEDLMKARFYLDMVIERIKEDE